MVTAGTSSWSSCRNTRFAGSGQRTADSGQPQRRRRVLRPELILGASERSPTDVEWEAAARGPSSLPFPWGSELPDATRGNICDASCAQSWRWTGWRDEHAALAPVHAYPLGDTPSGIADLCGNVWEWTASTDGSAVVRGGSYLNAPDNCEASVPMARTARRRDVGFRCARSE
jgi:formylglycine-generating enzyme required for sulfatase activity